MSLLKLKDKAQEWHSLGGVGLVIKGLYTKLESNIINVDETESQVTITLNGVNYEVCEGESVYRWNRFQRGVIMPELKRAMKELLESGDTYVDIGAATGDTSFFAHSIVRDNGEVHAFEPDPFMYQGLESNIARNNINNIFIYNMAMGDRVGELEPRQVIGGGTKRLKDNFHKLDPIPANTLDRYISENSLSPDLVKIDVDGVEDAVLRGGEDYVIGHMPVVLELHNSSLLPNRSGTINWIFEHAKEVIFLGAQGTDVTNHRFGDELTGPEELREDTVVNLLVR